MLFAAFRPQEIKKVTPSRDDESWEVDEKHPSEALGSQDDKKRRIEGRVIPLKPKDGLNGAPSIRW
jgi:hypothetical protein